MVIIRGGRVPLKLDIQSQEDGRFLDVDWRISMEVICISSLGVIQNEFKMYFCINVESYNGVSINSLIKNFHTTATEVITVFRTAVVSFIL